MTKLKTIEQHNKEKLHYYESLNLTGIACPNCDEELRWINKNVQLMTNPPKASVVCLKCEFQDYVIV